MSAHGPPDIKNRMAPVATLNKSCNQATHEGSFVDLAVFVDAKKCIVAVGPATGTPDSYSVVLTLRENTVQNSSGDTQMLAIDEVNGASVDSKTVTADGVYVLHAENTKRYAALSAAVTLVNGSTPLLPICGVFIGEQERF